MRACVRVCGLVQVMVNANEVFHVVLVDLSDDSRDYLEEAGRYLDVHAQ